MPERERESSGRHEGGEEIKVTDRRKFTQTGERREGVAPEPETEPEFSQEVGKGGVTEVLLRLRQVTAANSASLRASPPLSIILVTS